MIECPECKSEYYFGTDIGEDIRLKGHCGCASRPADAKLEPDLVNHPPHYQAVGIESIDVIEAFELNFRLGNVVKYILRAGRKGDFLQDLEKAKWYLDREVNTRRTLKSLED